MATYPILSLDGGGIRGVLTARLLDRILQKRPLLMEKTRLFTGTSTGSILAIALAKGLQPAEIVDLYRLHGKEVFAASFWHKVFSLDGLVAARFSAQPLYRLLATALGTETRLKDLLPKHVLIPTFQLDSANPLQPSGTNALRSWKAKFYHNYPGPDSDGNMLAVEVILQSTAAPLFFPIHQGFIDGGIVANNPSLCALTQALHPLTGKQELTNIRLLAIGTGRRPLFVSARYGDWGVLQWGYRLRLHLLDLALESSNDLPNYQCQQLLGPSYFRLDPLLEADIGLDAVDKVPLLIEVADATDISGVENWLAQNNW